MIDVDVGGHSTFSDSKEVSSLLGYDKIFYDRSTYTQLVRMLSKKQIYYSTPSGLPTKEASMYPLFKLRQALEMLVIEEIDNQSRALYMAGVEAVYPVRTAILGN